MIKVKQIRSVIGSKPNQRKTVKALGLKRINHVKELPDNDCIRGMINIAHKYVEVVK